MDPITLCSAKAQPVEAAAQEEKFFVSLLNFWMPPWLNKGGSFFSWMELAPAG